MHCHEMKIGVVSMIFFNYTNSLVNATFVCLEKVVLSKIRVTYTAIPNREVHGFTGKVSYYKMKRKFV